MGEKEKCGEREKWLQETGVCTGGSQWLLLVVWSIWSVWSVRDLRDLESICNRFASDFGVIYQYSFKGKFRFGFTYKYMVWYERSRCGPKGIFGM